MNRETKALNHSSRSSLFFSIPKLQRWPAGGTGMPVFAYVPMCTVYVNCCFPIMSAKGWGWAERCSITFKSFFHRKSHKNATGALTSFLLIEKIWYQQHFDYEGCNFPGTSNSFLSVWTLFELLSCTFYPMQVFHCLNEILDLCHSFCSLVSQNLGPLDERGAAQLSILVKVNLCLHGPVLPCEHLPKQSSWLKQL